MRNSSIRWLIAALIVASMAALFWRSQMGVASTSFSGPDFHSGVEADRDAVDADLTTYLLGQGFHEGSAPSAMAAGSGIHSVAEQPHWFEKQESGSKSLWVLVARDAVAVRTEIKWQSYGTKSANRRAEADAYRFAIDFDSWMNSRPQGNQLPANLAKIKSDWFREALAKCSVR